MSTKKTIRSLAEQLAYLLQQQHLRCAVAESCTGGSLAAALTDIPGSSHWFDCGVVTYANTAKHALLKVPNPILLQHGAVSQATVCAMAKGVLNISDATVSMATSGIAGPGGGTIEKPVGTVWIAWALSQQSIQSKQYLFSGNRTTIRQHAVMAALEGLLFYLRQSALP